MTYNPIGYPSQVAIANTLENATLFLAIACAGSKLAEEVVSFKVAKPTNSFLKAVAFKTLVTLTELASIMSLLGSIIVDSLTENPPSDCNDFKTLGIVIS